jgi:hypothetical protein
LLTDKKIQMDSTSLAQTTGMHWGNVSIKNKKVFTKDMEILLASHLRMAELLQCTETLDEKKKG